MIRDNIRTGLLYSFTRDRPCCRGRRRQREVLEKQEVPLSTQEVYKLKLAHNAIRDPETGKTKTRWAGAKPRWNIFAYHKSLALDGLDDEDRQKSDRIRLLYNTHIDNVPPHFPGKLRAVWDEPKKDDEEAGEGAGSKNQKGADDEADPFKDESKTHLVGRGSVDTKGLTAAALEAALKLEPKVRRQLAFLFTVSEETTHRGMTKANELLEDHAAKFGRRKKDPGVEFLLVGEPTESKIAYFQKGVLSFRVECEGISAHSGYPEEGESATDKLVSILHNLRYPHGPARWPGLQLSVPGLETKLKLTTDVNIGVISASGAANVINSRAESQVLMRLISEPDGVIEQIHAVVDAENAKPAEDGVSARKKRCEALDVQGQARLGNKHARVQPNGPVDMRYALDFFRGDGAKQAGVDQKWDFTAVNYNTDISYLDIGGGSPLLFGHGDIRRAHTDWEFVKVEDELERGVEDYRALFHQILSTPAGTGFTLQGRPSGVDKGEEEAEEDDEDKEYTGAEDEEFVCKGEECGFSPRIDLPPPQDADDEL